MRISVAVTSCNRERYLVEALDSVLAQRVEGGFEIVVGDDASGPRTRALLAEYQRRNSDRVRLVLQPENVGLAANFAATFSACRGEYVALLDDDDLWTSPDKLRLQADYLDAHPECALAFHVTRHFHEDGSRPDYFLFLRREAEQYTLDDLRGGGFIPTSTTMVRRAVLAPLPQWFGELRSHEWAVHLLAARHGLAGFLDVELSATRIHDAGKWNRKSPVEQHLQVIHNATLLRHHLEFLRTPSVAALLSRSYFELANEYRVLGEFDQARHSALRSILERPLHDLVPLSARLKLLAATLARSLFARMSPNRPPPDPRRERVEPPS